MERPRVLHAWDFQTVGTPNGYDIDQVPDLTRDNLNTLIEEHNHLVDVVNALCDHLGVDVGELI